MNTIDWYGTAERPEERALLRRIRFRAVQSERRTTRRRAVVAAVEEAFGLVAVAAMGLALLWLFMAATPRQSSAVNDLDAAAEAARSDTEAMP